MYPIPSTEKLVETKNCRHCQGSFPITDKDLEFYEKVSPVFANKRYSIPTPTLCPDCRQQRRLTFRNERKLYKRNCDATGKSIISMYSPDKLSKVYHQDFWWSDAWDPMDYGRDFDFEGPFLEQFRELIMAVPRPALSISSSEHAEYCNIVGNMKSCYLVSASWECDEVLYSTRVMNSWQSMDISGCSFMHECYECSECDHCWSCSCCIDSVNCRDSAFLSACVGCSNCYLCENLQNRRYCIRNIEYSEEEYRRKLQELEIVGYAKLWIEFMSRRRTAIHRYGNVVACKNAHGDKISECSDSFAIFNATKTKNGKYVENGGEGADDVYDGLGFGYDQQLGYEILDTGAQWYRQCFTITSHGCRDVFYAFDIHSSSHLFWCIGLRNKSYCILNKQYTKEEYETLVPKIIEHMMKTPLRWSSDGQAFEWWEFFPSSLSPFWYNETVAQEYYPMTRDQILASPMRGGGTNAESTGGVRLEASEWSPLTPLHKGGESEAFLHWPAFNWSDYEPPFPKVEKIIPASKLPQDIKDIPDDILNWAIECEVTKKPFRIIKQELEFYRKHNLPIPKRHPDQRHLDRMAQRNPRKLFERKCDCCKKDMITTYAPERPERVYCEECYNRGVIG